MLESQFGQLTYQEMHLQLSTLTCNVKAKRQVDFLFAKLRLNQVVDMLHYYKRLGPGLFTSSDSFVALP
jgi:hypothetical protein